MAVTLGKDCFISVGGASAAVRSVVWTETAKEIEVQPFGQMRTLRYVSGYEGSVEVEFLDDPNLWSSLEEGSPVSIVGDGGGGVFVITSIQRSEPLDDVVTFRIQAKYGG